MTPPALVAIHPRARAAWDLPAALPAGAVVLGLTGERLRVCGCGSVRELLEVPRRWSAIADPTATRRP